MIIDTHLHLIDRTALRYPWLSGVPALDHDFSYETYALEARRAGIGTSLHMEVDVDPADIEAETEAVKSQAQRPGVALSGAIAACRPEESGFAAYLERAQADSFIKGFRRVLHVVPDDISESALFRENIRRLGGTGLPFDLCVRADQLSKAIALADAAPDVQFVLDHCGNPDVKGNAASPWSEHIADLARRPNLAAKISGIVVNADAANWEAETLRPYVEHVIGAFGWDRVVWGSDWPVCTLAGSLSSWVAATHAVLEGNTPQERGKLFSGNAQRLWRLATPTG